MGQKLTRTGEVIEHRGAQILFNDFSGLSGHELTDALKEISRAMAPRTTNKKDWLSIALFTGAKFDEHAAKILIKVHRSMADCYLAIAEVGMSAKDALAVQLVNTVAHSNVPIRFFDSIDEAKEWVVEVHGQKVSQKTSI